MNMTVEQAMQNSHRSVRERLGMGVVKAVVLSRPKEITPPPEPPKPTARPKAIPLPNVDQAIIDMVNANLMGEDRAWMVNQRWRQIVEEVQLKYGITPLEMKSRYRDRRLVMARHEAFYRMRHETTLSLPQIAQRMGGFDHTSVLHGIKRHAARLAHEQAERELP